LESVVEMQLSIVAHDVHSNQPSNSDRVTLQK